MSKLKTMIPIASVLVLSVATVACAETATAPAKPAEQPAKPTMPMEGKCGGSMKMGEGKCGAEAAPKTTP